MEWNLSPTHSSILSMNQLHIISESYPILGQSTDQKEGEQQIEVANF